MLSHDAIYDVFEILVSKEADFDKYVELQTRFGINEIEELCRNFEEEDICLYVGKRLAKLEETVNAYIEYSAHVKQLRATYRGQIYKAQLRDNNKKTL